MTIPFDLDQMIADSKPTVTGTETYLVAAKCAIEDALLNERTGQHGNALFYARECLGYLDLLGVSK